MHMLHFRLGIGELDGALRGGHRVDALVGYAEVLPSNLRAALAARHWQTGYVVGPPCSEGCGKRRDGIQHLCCPVLPNLETHGSRPGIADERELHWHDCGLDPYRCTPCIPCPKTMRDPPDVIYRCLRKPCVTPPVRLFVGINACIDLSKHEPGHRHCSARTDELAHITARLAASYLAVRPRLVQQLVPDLEQGLLLFRWQVPRWGWACEVCYHAQELQLREGQQLALG